MNYSAHQQMLSEVRREIADLEDRLQELRAVERWHASRVGSGPPAVAAPPTTNGEAKPFANVSMKEAAEVVLKEAGGPLSTRQIADAILGRGYQTKNPEGMRNATFSMLDREKEIFRKTGKGLWDLKEKEN